MEVTFGSVFFCFMGAQVVYSSSLSVTPGPWQPVESLWHKELTARAELSSVIMFVTSSLADKSACYFLFLRWKIHCRFFKKELIKLVLDVLAQPLQLQCIIIVISEHK